MNKKVYIIGNGVIPETDRLFLKTKNVNIEVLSDKQYKEVVILSKPKPMPISASPIIDYMPFIPPLTRTERRKLKRKNEKIK